MRSSSVISAIFAAIPFTQGAELLPRSDTCGTGYTVCAPSGATTTTVPKIGDASFRLLFTDLVDTRLPDGNSKKRRDEPILHPKRGSASLCCQDTTLCYSMNTLAIPFCYDKFTTNFFLPDGSYGTLYFGTYTSSSGDTANLISGNYTLKAGGSGNIYTADEAEKPNTSTMSVPSQFTGSGVGSAIPASALGAFQTVVFTEVLSATTVPATTLSASTVTRTSSITGSASTGGMVYISTVPATTIQGTTITAVTTAVTTATVAASEASSVVSSASAAAAAHSTAAAVEGSRVAWEVLAGGLALGAAAML